MVAGIYSRRLVVDSRRSSFVFELRIISLLSTVFPYLLLFGDSILYVSRHLPH